MIQTNRLVLAIILLGIGTVASAQNQPWKAPWGSVESRVLTCTSPQPMNRVAMDDFQFTQTTKITWIRWWGTVSSSAQLQRKYFIAIRPGVTAGTCPVPCNAGQISNFWCVDVSTKYAGKDCQNRRVYRFTATLTPPFFATGGQKYWLQISELDSDSVQVGVEDFRWSAHHPIHNCTAQQRDIAGGVQCAITDDCPNPVTTDLSFELHSGLIGGFVPLPPVILPPYIALAELRSPNLPTDLPFSVEVADIDDDGHFAIDTDVPDGDYLITLVGMGMSHPARPVQVVGGVGMTSFFDIFYGDLNNDSRVNGMDIPLMVNGLLNAP